MITEEIKEQIKEMIANKKSKRQIARHFNISLATIRNILGSNRKITDEQKDEVRKLYSQGLSKAEISIKMGVSWQSVNNIVLNKVYTRIVIPKKTSEEIRIEREERKGRLKDLIKDEDVVYPTELDKCLAEIYKSENDINYKQQL
jgi:DNA invertase Pin-like site-specific DNA recombinase